MTARAEAVARRLAGVMLATALVAQAASAQDRGFYTRSVWDLKPGTHARELSDEFANFACGSNGGPPSVLIDGWGGYRQCRPESDTGYHEVYFEYDDEPGYWAKARSATTQAEAYAFTTVFSIPVIASALFSVDGFLVGIRLVTDHRAPADLREKGPELGTFILGRYEDIGWTCNDLPQLEGEREYKGGYVKRQCRKSKDGLDLFVEVHHYRRPGQVALDPVSRLPTTGQFETSTRFQLNLAGFKADPARIAASRVAVPTEKDRLIERAHNCPGCNFENANLKRADLSGANLAGANLAGANLHGAILAGANLANADFSQANLNKVNARRADLRGAKLSEALMYETRFDAADLSGASLSGAFAGKVQLNRAKLRNATIVAADLRGARLGSADFTGADLSGSWLHESTLDRANLSGTKLTSAVLWNTSMVEANLTGANFQLADLFGANLRGSDLSAVDFSRARLTGANLHETTLSGVIWREAELPAGFVPPPR